jgi:hypothetical protein
LPVSSSFSWQFPYWAFLCPQSFAIFAPTVGWSIGVVFYCLLCLALDFDRLNQTTLSQKMTQSYPQHMLGLRYRRRNHSVQGEMQVRNARPPLICAKIKVVIRNL